MKLFYCCHNYEYYLQNGNGKHSQFAVYFLLLVLTMSKPNDRSITTEVRTKTNLKTKVEQYKQLEETTTRLAVYKALYFNDIV